MSSEPRIHVPCCECGTEITLTLSWYRRRMRDQNPPRCELCLTMDGLTTDDADLRFWLDAYGITPSGSAADHVAEHGLPAELAGMLSVLRGAA